MEKMIKAYRLNEHTEEYFIEDLKLVLDDTTDEIKIFGTKNEHLILELESEIETEMLNVVSHYSVFYQLDETNHISFIIVYPHIEGCSINEDFLMNTVLGKAYEYMYYVKTHYGINREIIGHLEFYIKVMHVVFTAEDFSFEQGNKWNYMERKMLLEKI